MIYIYIYMIYIYIYIYICVCMWGGVCLYVYKVANFWSVLGPLKAP